MSQDVLYERRGNVAYVTINRPDRRNALGRAVKAGLVETFTEVRNDVEVRAVVLTGAGDQAFCAGNDLKEVAERPAGNHGRPGPDSMPLDEFPASSTIV